MVKLGMFLFLALKTNRTGRIEMDVFLFCGFTPVLFYLLVQHLFFWNVLTITEMILDIMGI